MTEFADALEAIRPAVAHLAVRPAQAKPADRGTVSDATVAADNIGQLAARDTRVSIPLPTPAGAAPTPSEAGRVLNLSVVVVEPSRTQAGIVRRYLQQLGIDKVHVAATGKDALTLAKQARADVLFSSLHLADMTAVQLAAALRADPDSTHVGFILASSATDSDPSGELVRHPRTVLLRKPFDLKQLAQGLATATGRAPDEILRQQG
jgi:CheY-like chemotaxis protein